MAIPPLLKDLNERTVLEAIREEAPISRAEISRRAGISKPTVSLALQSLLDAGLVREAKVDPGRPSYGAVFFEPVPDAALVLGLDLGSRFLRGAVCDLGGRIRTRQDVEADAGGADWVLDVVAGLRDSLVAAAGASDGQLDGVVAGIPGVVTGSGEIRLALNVPRLEGRKFGEELAARLEVPVTLENDINLAALGERWQGVARGVDDFMFLSIGAGLGAGLVLDGELKRGRHGAAGELDYARAGRDDDFDPCAAAASALAARLAEGKETMLAPPFDTREIFTAARGRDAVARAVVAELARRIALHIVPIAAVADVELVVLGGGLGTNGDLLLGPVRAHLDEWLPFPPRVEVSMLGDAAVLTGALAVGRQAALENVFANRSARRLG
ncbi:MAG: ROK family transcriptional regulator [Actinobacteria bacterium]|nr:MAG: ROK family transcriptional regulator [Actinomycetota bacterium]